MTIKFKIENITCEACIKISRLALQDLAGVTQVDVQANGLATIETSAVISWEQIKQAMNGVDKIISAI